MVYSLEQQIFLILEFPRVDHNIVKTSCSFQRLFNGTKRPKRDTIKALLENIQLTGNVNHDHLENIGRLRASVTCANVEVVPFLRFSLIMLQIRLGCRTCLRTISCSIVSNRFQARQPLKTATINARETIAKAMLQLLHAGKIDTENIFIFRLSEFCP